MKRILPFLFFSATLACSFIYAETPKQSKTAKTNDVNKTMTDEEFMSQFMILDKRQKDAEAKTLQMQEKLEKIKKLRKTVDELGKQVGVD